jgi:signal peptidase II
MSRLMSGRGLGTGRIAVLLVAAIVAAIDLTAKTVSEVRLAHSPVDLGLVQLRLAHNSGVAFSIGATLPVGVRVALTAANDSPEAL